MHHPPVNAITVGDTWKIRDTFKELSERSEREDIRAIILTAEGKGFNAGIDIKEMQSVEGWDHLLGSGEACYAAFHQIYQTPIPVIAAVNDFCMGLGHRPRRELRPDRRLDEGALRAARGRQRGARLRLASREARPADEAARDVADLPPGDGPGAPRLGLGRLRRRARPADGRRRARSPRNIAKKQRAVVQFAKAALNHIDLHEMHANYRLEQGYTYQLNIMGDGDKARDAFIEGTRIITR